MGCVSDEPENYREPPKIGPNRIQLALALASGSTIRSLWGFVASLLETISN